MKDIDFWAGLSREEVLELCREIIENRESLGFGLVSRALCIESYLADHLVSLSVSDVSGKKRLATAEEVWVVLGCSRQLRNNWLNRDLRGWVVACEKALAGLKTNLVDKRSKKSRCHITADDWAWVDDILRKRNPSTYRLRAKLIREIASTTLGRERLAKLSYTALFIHQRSQKKP